MNLFFKKRKLNNKGNTLSVVLIGILVLAILGTLILNVTATNLRVRASEYRAEKQFYTAEKAIDLIYGGIGAEAMRSVTTSYNNVLTNYVKKSGTSAFKTLSNTEANDLFKENYINNLKDSTNGYPEGISGISDIEKRFKEYIKDVHNCELDMDNSSVEYDDNLNTKEIRVKNVKIITTKNGYSSSIKTDFLITTPTIDINFVDSSNKDFSYVFENALIINGNDDVASPALQVTNNTKFTINGNAYFGSNKAGITKACKKYSIKLNPSSTFTFNSDKNLVCKGSLVLNSANANIVTQRLWAKNLVTIGNNDNLKIDGNCIISDDLEVNGDNSTINISGDGYYGCGYEGSSDDSKSEEYKKEAAPGTATYFDDEDKVGSLSEFSHEKRSAIMINGKGANVDLSSLNQLILGGRAFIDLDNIGSEDFATYMTGESVSLKGNQNVYLADKSKLGSVSSNPCSYNEISKYVVDGVLNYDQLGIDNSVLAKKVGTDVFFYDKITNPVQQTNNFLANYSQPNAIKAITNSVHTLDVQKLLLPENRFTVGAVSQVESGYNYKMLGAGLAGSLSPEFNFYKLMSDLKLRTDFMTNQLKDFTSYTIGSQYIPQTQVARDTNPFEEFIDGTKLRAKYGSNNEDQNVQESHDPKIIDQDSIDGLNELLTKAGLTGTDRNTGIYFYDNAAKSEDKQIANGAHVGVIITTGDCHISDDFTGLIICGGNLRVDSNCTVTANAEIVQYLADHCPKLQELLSGYVPGTNSNAKVDINNVSYKDLVFTENWSKNVD